MKNLIAQILALLFATLLPEKAQPYHFQGLTGKEGLTELTITAIYKDTHGYVWLGTPTSVVRFDGVHVKHYPIYGFNAKSKWVNTIMKTLDGHILIGNETGLFRVEGDRLEPLLSETIRKGVRSLVCEADSTLYVASGEGLYIISGGRVETVLLDDNILSAANNIMALYLDVERTLWMLTHKGLYSMDLSSRKICYYRNTLADEVEDVSYRCLTGIGAHIYIGTMKEGIYCFDKQTQTFSPYVNVGCNVIMSLSSDERDLLYVATDGNGAHFISTSQHRIVRSFIYSPEAVSGIRTNAVYSLLVDRDGLIWVGTYQLGLDYTVYQSRLFSVYQTPYFSTVDIPIRTFNILPFGKMLGTRSGLFFVDERRQTVLRFGAPKEMRSNQVLCSYVFHDKLYIGTYGGGMYVFDPSTCQLSDFEPNIRQPFLDGHVFCITSDQTDRLWMATSNGLYCYDKERKLVKHFMHTNSHLPEGNVYYVFFDSTGKGWICTENGVCILDADKLVIRANVFPKGFPASEKMMAIYEDASHTLYFIPYKTNLFTSDISMKCFRRIPTDTALDGKEIMTITEDQEGWMWIGTSDGLFRYDKKETFVPYTFVDGIPDPIFLPCPSFMDKEGNLWFGNSKGLVELPKGSLKQKNGAAYQIAISTINVNGVPMDSLLVEHPGGNYFIELASTQNNVQIGFSDFTFTSPAYMNYEYCLDNTNKGWQHLIGRSEVNLYNLSPGKHLFKIRRTGVPGSERMLAIHVRVPIWRIVGIAAACAMVLGIAFFLYYRFRRKTDEGVSCDSVIFLPEKNKVEPLEKDVPQPVSEKYKAGRLPDEECKRLAKALKLMMENEKLYINPNLRIGDLAARLGVSSNNLSYLFNVHLQHSYYDYINDYRVIEFKKLVSQGMHNKYTLQVLMELSGFNSRASFFRIFKKLHNITPKEYITRQEEGKK